MIERSGQNTMKGKDIRDDVAKDSLHIGLRENRSRANFHGGERSGVILFQEGQRRDVVSFCSKTAKDREEGIHREIMRIGEHYT
jgi:hypothetical protein